MNNYKSTFVLLLLFQSFLFAQKHVLVDTNTTTAARNRFKENLISNIIEKNLNLPLNSENERNWMSAFWGMELILYKNSSIRNSIVSAINDYPNRTEDFNRSALEAAYTLFPTELEKEFKVVIQVTTIPKHFVMAFNYLYRLSSAKYSSAFFLKTVQRKFVKWQDNPILFMLHTKLNYSSANQQRPPLIDLLKHNFGDNRILIFSLQRENRDYPGLLIIRKPNGEFLRKDDGTIFKISQLARSINNMPGYITNGNTPQGIFSIQGIDTSQNYFIGKTPNIQLVLPYETDVSKYFHMNSEYSDWNDILYKEILPLSWQDYLPFYETYYAGKAGRNEIIAHGTTIDLNFYEGKGYYPHTPTLGCLCAVEIWSPKDGKLIYSDQAALISEFEKLNDKRGYLVVVEIDDKNAPVTLNNVLPEILKAEEFLLNNH